MPQYSGDNPYGPGPNLGWTSNGLPFGAQGGPSNDSLNGIGIPTGSNPAALASLLEDAKAQGPFIGMEQGLANSMQNLNPNASVGKQLWQNQANGAQWVDQGIDQQQKAYDLAKSYANGADTAAYKQLGQSHNTANALGAGSAMSAGGGARGAAAARTNMQDAAGQTADMQRASLGQQKQLDKQNYTAAAATLGNQLMGSQLGKANQQGQWQNSQGEMQGAYQQMGDTASLNAGTMLEGLLQQDYGQGYGAASQYTQNNIMNQQLSNQMMGAGFSAGAGGLSQLANNSGNGGGGGSNNNPYGLGSNAENPWWNPNS